MGWKVGWLGSSELFAPRCGLGWVAKVKETKERAILTVLYEMARYAVICSTCILVPVEAKVERRNRNAMLMPWRNTMKSRKRCGELRCWPVCPRKAKSRRHATSNFQDSNSPSSTTVRCDVIATTLPGRDCEPTPLVPCSNR